MMAGVNANAEALARRPPAFGPVPDRPLAAEGLAADDGADLVAVDVDIARPDARATCCTRVVDPGVQPEGQAVARGVDRVDHASMPRPEGRHVQDGAEDLALQIARCRRTRMARGDEMPSPGARSRCRRRPSASAASI
jgi:hypothetical protein